jgi:hypothetical protein
MFRHTPSLVSLSLIPVLHFLIGSMLRLSPYRILGQVGIL